HRTRAVLKWLGAGLAALIVAGAVFQQIGLVLDQRVAPPATDIVSVSGRAVHLACSGRGARTIILDAGAGAGVFEWFRLQPMLASSARVCSFDRAGLGWSDAAQGGYDGRAAAEQLAALVKSAHIPTPFVYVGHSLGANFAEVYWARHPGDVAALVLIEPGVPSDLLEDFHGTRNEAMASADCNYMCYGASAITALGLARLISFT